MLEKGMLQDTASEPRGSPVEKRPRRAVCIWPDPRDTQFLSQRGHGEHPHVRAEHVLAASTGHGCTSAAERPGPRDSEMLGAQTPDAEELLGACPTRVLWCP